MKTTMEQIKKIMGYKTWSDKRKEDALLELDASLYCNLGTESTKAEKAEVRRISRQIYGAIEKINPFWGNYFRLSMDK